MATIESVGGFGFGNTNTATAKNIGATAALLIAFGLAIGIAGSVGYQLGKHFAGRSIPPTPAPVDLRGTAIVYSNGRHASIEVNGPSTLHTEQLTLGGGKQTTISAVDSPDEFAQTLKRSNAQTLKRSNAQTLKRSNAHCQMHITRDCFRI